MPLPSIQTLKGLTTKVIMLTKKASTVISTATTMGIISRNLRRLV